MADLHLESFLFLSIQKVFINFADPNKRGLPGTFLWAPVVKRIKELFRFKQELKMKCHIAENLITRFCESQVDSVDDQKLFNHLDRCERCRDIVWGIGERIRRGEVSGKVPESRPEINRLTSLVLENFCQ